MSEIIISDSFDNVRLADFRLVELAAERGDVHVCLWSDEAVRCATGSDPKFPQAEREYLVQAIKHVSGVTIVPEVPSDALPGVTGPDVAGWVMRERDVTDAKRAFCDDRGIKCVVIKDEELSRLPDWSVDDEPVGGAGRKKVIVTGCYDWFHTGHIAFFEEVSEYGDLYVCVGNDANVKNLKGAGHPMFPEWQRRYIVGSIRYVYSALLTSGWGWMDAEPEIERLKPDIYAVNEDGDRPEKREFCEKHGLEYLVLKRIPKEGLQKRESTHLRGF